MNRLLVVDSVTKVFKQAQRIKVALQNVSFERDIGCTALLGFNGSGKTTLLNLILGIIIPDEGRILVEGLDPKTHPGKASFPFFPWYDPRMTVNDFIFALEMMFDTHINENYLKLLELEDYLDVQLQKLSSGYEMRLRLLSALTQPSNVILLDEITNGLDVKSVEVFTNVVNKIKKEKLVIFATHVFDHAEAVADNVLVLHEGKLRFDGTARDFLKLAKPVIEVKGKNIPFGVKEGGVYTITSEDPEKDLPKMIREIIEKGGHIEEVKVVPRGFKSAFLEVIKSEEAR